MGTRCPTGQKLPPLSQFPNLTDPALLFLLPMVPKYPACSLLLNRRGQDQKKLELLNTKPPAQGGAEEEVKEKGKRQKEGKCGLGKGLLTKGKSRQKGVGSSSKNAGERPALQMNENE